MKIGSLFSGIGGLERGMEAAVPGARVIWQAESDPHARAVLAQHYPDARRYNDVREIDERADHVDIICGGFPCQDISLAGAGAGIDGPRSGLWAEYARIVRVLRPGLVFIENVAALLGRGLDRVLGDLAACGYDAVWETFRASDVGAPHRRDRLFLLAYADGERVRELRRWIDGQGRPASQAEPAHDGAELADPHGEAGGREAWGAIGGDGGEALWAGEEKPGRRGGDVADPDSGGFPARSGTPTGDKERSEHGHRGHASRSLADADSLNGHGRERDEGRRSARGDAAAGNGARGNGSGMADPVRRRQRQGQWDVRAWQPDADRSREGVADADGEGWQREIWGRPSGARRRHAAMRGEQTVADADSLGREQQRIGGIRQVADPQPRDHAHGCNCPRCYAHRFPPGPDQIQGWDGPQPAVRRSDDGVPGRSHRLRLLGNAVVPQQATLAFLTLLAAARAEHTARAA